MDSDPAVYMTNDQITGLIIQTMLFAVLSCDSLLIPNMFLGIPV
jgi:hypothetical protein